MGLVGGWDFHLELAMFLQGYDDIVGQDGHHLLIVSAKGNVSAPSIYGQQAQNPILCLQRDLEHSTDGISSLKDNGRTGRCVEANADALLEDRLKACITCCEGERVLGMARPAMGCHHVELSPGLIR